MNKDRPQTNRMRYTGIRRMKLPNRLYCLLLHHRWQNDQKSWPTHGYQDLPYVSSYCGRCLLPASKVYPGLKGSGR